MKEGFRPSDQEKITPEVRKRVKELLNTPVWDTQELLHLPAGQVSFVEVERDLPEPAKAAKIRISTWISKLKEKKDTLTKANPSAKYDIHEDTKGVPCLFEKMPDGEEKPKMWAGTTVTLSQKGVEWKGDNFLIPVYPINYTEWIACHNPKYAEAFKKESLVLPYAGIGISVLAETTDGFLPLTRRGIETPVYPGMLYSPGGGPKPGEGSTEALLNEIVEETGLQNGEHFDLSRLTMLALVGDSKFANSQHLRPELVAYLPLKTDFRTVEEIQHEKSIKKGQKQEDIWGVRPISTFIPNLAREMIYGGYEMCPPTEAGLAHTIFYKLAGSQGLDSAFLTMEEVMNRLKSFKRVVYEPPIKRLSNLDI